MAISGVGGSGSIPQPFVRVQAERPDTVPFLAVPNGSVSGSASAGKSGTEPARSENSGVVVSLTDRPATTVDVPTAGPRATPVIREQSIPLSAAATQTPSRTSRVNQEPGRVSDLGKRSGEGSIQNAVVQQIQTNNTEIIGLFLDRFF